MRPNARAFARVVVYCGAMVARVRVGAAWLGLGLAACGANVRGDLPMQGRDVLLGDATIGPVEGCASVDGTGRGRWEVIEHPAGFTRRAGAKVLAFERSIAIIGGYGEDNTATDNWRYEHETRRWTRLGAPWTSAASRHMSAAWLPEAREFFVWRGPEPGRVGRGVRLALDGTSREVSSEGAPRTVVQRVVAVAGMVFVAAGVTDGDHNEFALYDPRSDRWQSVLAPREQNARGSFSLVADERTVTLWGGSDATISTGGARDDGWRFDVLARQWSGVSRVRAASARWGHDGLWIGDSMWVWGGYDRWHLRTGARYFAGPDQWLPMSALGAPGPSSVTTSFAHWSAWTGSDVFVWTLTNAGEASAGRWDPRADRWFAAEPPPLAAMRREAASAWSDCALYVVGGRHEQRYEFATEVLRWVP